MHMSFTFELGFLSSALLSCQLISDSISFSSCSFLEMTEVRIDSISNCRQSKSSIPIFCSSRWVSKLLNLGQSLKFTDLKSMNIRGHSSSESRSFLPFPFMLADKLSWQSWETNNLPHKCEYVKPQKERTWYQKTLINLNNTEHRLNSTHKCKQWR